MGCEKSQQRGTAGGRDEIVGKWRWRVSCKIAGKQKREITIKISDRREYQNFQFGRRGSRFLGWWKQLCMLNEFGGSGRITFGFGQYVL
jgi:hypothetical protein